ncbi:MAG: tetratricopeptide repeat protein [Cyclobacteriaceae bacterium]
MKYFISLLSCILFFTAYTQEPTEQDSLTISQEAYETAMQDYDEGIDLFYQKKYHQALPLLQEATELNPHNSDYWYGLSSVLNGLNNLEEAKKSISQALTLEPNQSDYLLHRANVHFKLKEYQSSIDDYTNALKYQDSSDIPLNEGHVYFNRGNCWLYLKKYQSAVYDFDAALDSGYELANVYHNRATALIRLGQKSKACQDFQKAIDLGSKITGKYLTKYCN